MFLYAFSSVMIHGVGRDADRIAEAIAQRSRRIRAARAGPAGWATAPGYAAGR
jgi:hypothetical protein